MQTNRLSRVISAAVVAGIVGCVSSPPTRFYRLTPESVPATATSTQAVIVGPFRLADYLDRPQIVTREGPNVVRVADFDRWAEPLDANFQGVVAANVGRLLGSDRVLEFPVQGGTKIERRVMGRVSQLDVDAAGLAVLEVQWGVLNEDGGMLQPARRSRYEIPATGKSYVAKVAALNSAVARFSEDVAAAVR